MSCILSKMRDFKKVFVKFPLDIEIFSRSILKQIEDFCDHCIDFQQVEGLFMQLTPESGDEEDKLVEDKLVEELENMQIKKDEDYEPEEILKNPPLECLYTFERMQEIYEMCKTSARSSVGKKIHKSKDQIDAICKRVEKGPSYEYKMMQLKVMLETKFQDEMDRGTVIKGDTLMIWANEIKNELEELNPSKENEEGLENSFKFTSRSFIDSFKKENNIVSRKINSFVSKKKRENQAKLIADAQEFVLKINELISKNEFHISKIFNSDQSKIEYEMTTQRTLHRRGAKKVECIVGNINATTHSYTIQVSKFYI